MFVYVIAASAAVKIGISNDPARRLGEAATYSPWGAGLHYAHEVPAEDARDIEATCHQILKNSRLEGEWFQERPDTAEALVKRVAEQFAGRDEDGEFEIVRLEDNPPRDEDGGIMPHFSREMRAYRKRLKYLSCADIIYRQLDPDILGLTKATLERRRKNRPAVSLPPSQPSRGGGA